jgi:hypothetical protein
MEEKEIKILEQIKIINEDVGPQFTGIYPKLENQFTKGGDHVQMVKFKTLMRRMADSGKIIWEEDGAVRITEFGVREISIMKNQSKVNGCEHEFIQRMPFIQTSEKSYPSTVICDVCGYEISTSEYVALNSLKNQQKMNFWLVFGTWVMAVGTITLAILALWPKGDQ